MITVLQVVALTGAGVITAAIVIGLMAFVGLIIEGAFRR